MRRPEATRRARNIERSGTTGRDDDPTVRAGSGTMGQILWISRHGGGRADFFRKLRRPRMERALARDRKIPEAACFKAIRHAATARLLSNTSRRSARGAGCARCRPEDAQRLRRRLFVLSQLARAAGQILPGPARWTKSVWAGRCSQAIKWEKLPPWGAANMKEAGMSPASAHWRAMFASTGDPKGPLTVGLVIGGPTPGAGGWFVCKACLPHHRVCAPRLSAHSPTNLPHSDYGTAWDRTSEVDGCNAVPDGADNIDRLTMPVYRRAWDGRPNRHRAARRRGLFTSCTRRSL